MDVALAELRTARRDTADEISASAVLQTYQPYFSELNGIPLVPTFADKLRLWDPERDRFLASIDLKKIDQLLQDSLIPEEIKQDFFANLGYENTISSDYLDSVEQTELRNQRTRRNFWDRDIRVLKHDAGPLDFTRKKTIRQAREHHHATGIANVLVQWSILTRVANPVLIASAPVETVIRTSVGALANAMTGPSGLSFNDLDVRIRDASKGFIDTQGVNQALKDIFDDSMYASRGVDGKMNRVLRQVFRWQSWTRSNKAVARTMTTSIARSVASAPGQYGGLTVDSALALWETDPLKFREKFPALWEMAIAAGGDAFGMRMPAAATALNKGLARLSTSHPAAGAVSDVLLRAPLAFSGYFYNVLVNMTGMQGVQALFDTGTALLLDRTDRTRGMSRDIMKSAQIEVDFASLMVRGGISHAALLVLGSLAQAFLGDDDEWDAKEELENKGIITLWDVRKFQNDWRNREALYLEGTPLEGLAGLFTIGQNEDGSSISAFEPAWYVKQFTSPFIGIARFMRSGHFSDVTDGFADALGNMPLAGDLVSSFSGMAQTNELLAQRAAAETSGETVSDADIARSYKWLTKAVMNYERIFLEWGFLNQLYVGLDAFQRDPFAIPDVDADGNTQVDKTRNPMETLMQTQRLGETGEAYETEEGYSGFHAQMRSYAANRFGFATVLNILPGLQGENYRWDMPISEMKINKQEIELVEDQAALVLSMWDEDEGNEVLTVDGAAAVVRSLHAGLVRPGIPSLENIYLTYEQREALTEYFTKEFMDAGLENGLTADEAEAYAKTMYFGDPDTGISPLRDVIWSQGRFDKAIPYERTTTYQKLNSTYAVGPDGKYWATGLERGFSSNFAGLAPMQRFAGAGGTNAPFANLSLDELLNSTDTVANVNTGQRMLRRVDDTQITVRDEDILAKMDGIIKNIKDDYEKGGYGKGGGGRSYASNTYMPYLNRMNSPYWDNIPTIFGDNVSVRRADIRRERFTSDRGRLLPWQ